MYGVQFELIVVQDSKEDTDNRIVIEFNVTGVYLANMNFPRWRKLVVVTPPHMVLKRLPFMTGCS